MEREGQIEANEDEDEGGELPDIENLLDGPKEKSFHPQQPEFQPSKPE
jgi:hypothetical protein